MFIIVPLTGYVTNSELRNNYMLYAHENRFALIVNCGLAMYALCESSNLMTADVLGRAYCTERSMLCEGILKE
jgi:hypothetical protein